MKIKIGTVLDAGLLRQARTVAAREGKRLNQVPEEEEIEIFVPADLGSS